MRDCFTTDNNSFKIIYRSPRSKNFDPDINQPNDYTGESLKY